MAALTRLSSGLIGFLVINLLILGATGPGVGHAVEPPAPTILEQTQVDPDRVVLRLTIHENGSATWQVEHRVRLEDENATEAFESLQEDVAANRSDFIQRFEDRMKRTARAAENSTGREMSIQGVTVETTRQELPDEFGILTYTFEWIGFGEVTDSTILIGDAIEGLFLDERSTLMISWPTGYQYQEVSPSPDEERDRTVVWRGPIDFATGEPRIVIAPGSGTPITDGSPTENGVGNGDGQGNDGGTNGGQSQLFTPFQLGIAGVVLLILFAVGWYAAKYSGRETPDSGDEQSAIISDSDDELLSNEEQVIQLLKQHGGRMKQQQVVEELGWTDAKTSQVVGKLRDSGEIGGFRLGRENVLRLPEEAEDSERESDS